MHSLSIHQSFSVQPAIRHSHPDLIHHLCKLVHFTLAHPAHRCVLHRLRKLRHLLCRFAHARILHRLGKLLHRLGKLLHLLRAHPALLHRLSHLLHCLLHAAWTLHGHRLLHLLKSMHCLLHGLIVLRQLLRSSRIWWLFVPAIPRVQLRLLELIQRLFELLRCLLHRLTRWLLGVLLYLILHLDSKFAHGEHSMFLVQLSFTHQDS